MMTTPDDDCRALRARKRATNLECLKWLSPVHSRNSSWRVVDASLVVKWFIPEIHSEAARRWLDASHEYVAPDLLFSEAGNTVWKKVRRKELGQAEGRQLVKDLAQVGVETVATRSLLEDALALALTAGITVYDAMYLALAVRLETEVITGDDRFPGKIAGRPLLARHVRRL